MGSEDLQKKLKRKKKATQNTTNPSEIESRELFNNEDENLSKVKGEKKKKKSLEERKRNKNKAISQVDEPNVSEDEVKKSVRGKKEIKSSGKNKRKKDKVELTESEAEEKGVNEVEDGIEEENTDVNEAEEHKKRKSKKKKRSENLEASRIETKTQVDGSDEAGNETNIRTRKSKKARKAEKMEHLPSKDERDLLMSKDAEDEVYQMSSGDEDSSKGMKKWITEYKQSRPGLKELQDTIDDFIIAHEEQEKQAREEREAQAAEGGWTVVVHHKGRKKTTEAETGVAVGSVAEAAVLDKMAKKKNKDVGLDFYRFQKREAHRNEIMMLQSKFEQDKKRIQQLRAQRKFRPY